MQVILHFFIFWLTDTNIPSFVHSYLHSFIHQFIDSLLHFSKSRNKHVTNKNPHFSFFQGERGQPRGYARPGPQGVPGADGLKGLDGRPGTTLARGEYWKPFAPPFTRSLAPLTHSLRSASASRAHSFARSHCSLIRYAPHCSLRPYALHTRLFICSLAHSHIFSRAHEEKI